MNNKFYFDMLTEEQQQKFKEACRKQRIGIRQLMSSESHSFAGFLLGSFNFAKTGNDYWWEVAFPSNYKCLFDDHKNMPRKLAELVERNATLEEIEAIGFTYDTGLDGTPYGLRPIGVHITKLEGYED